METIKKSDCIELSFTGYHDGKVFDSNVEEDLKEVNSEAKPQKTIVIVGQGMVVKGLDNELVGKEVGKEYRVAIPYKDGFGERRRELVKTIPLAVFTKQKINPKPGATLFLDNHLARVITVSGARVITDFNNPLAGKDIEYKFTVKRIVSDEREKVESFFEFFLRMKPDFEVREKEIVVKGPKPFEHFVTAFKDKFKEAIGKGLGFEEVKEEKKEAASEDKKEQSEEDSAKENN